jgi:hypothetical protein
VIITPLDSQDENNMLSEEDEVDEVFASTVSVKNFTCRNCNSNFNSNNNLHAHIRSGCARKTAVQLAEKPAMPSPISTKIVESTAIPPKGDGFAFR